MRRSMWACTHYYYGQLAEEEEVVVGVGVGGGVMVVVVVVVVVLGVIVVVVSHPWRETDGRLEKIHVGVHASGLFQPKLVGSLQPATVLVVARCRRGEEAQRVDMCAAHASLRARKYMHIYIYIYIYIYISVYIYIYICVYIYRGAARQRVCSSHQPASTGRVEDETPLSIYLSIYKYKYIYYIYIYIHIYI